MSGPLPPSGGEISADIVTRVNAAYHDAVAEEYDERGEGTDPYVIDHYRRLFADHVLPRLPDVADVRCVDLGCGSGYLEQFLPPNIDVFGIDVSNGMLERARSRFPAARFEIGDVYTFDPGPRYHLTMAKALLHHLVDFEQVVDRMAAATAPGGVLVIANEPNRRAYRYLAPLKRAFRLVCNRERGALAVERLGDARYETLSEYHLFQGDGIDASALAQRLRGAGFSDVKVFFSLRELFATFDAVRPALQLNRRVPARFRDHFPLSRNFDLVAYKGISGAAPR